MADKMTAWGVGPRLTCISFPYLALAAILHFSYPEFFAITQTPDILFPLAGSILIVSGLVLWALGARIIDRAFNEGRLLTTGVYGLVRNPMYSGFIVFVTPGIGLCLRSWLLLTVPFVAYVIFRLLIKQEEQYLEAKFGQEYLEYKSRVNALVPFIRFPK